MEKLDKNRETEFLINWLDVLQRGYVKPDVYSTNVDSCNKTGVVRDTKDYKNTIKEINKKIGKNLGLEEVQIQKNQLK